MKQTGGIIIVLIFLIFAFSLLKYESGRIDDIEQEISTMPHKICHNETELKQFNNIGYISDVNGNILCPSYFYTTQEGKKICLEEQTKEVCEIK